MKKTVIIGAGFSGLSAACYLAAAGAEVTVLEKHPGVGGRARQLEREGFVFDMGPTFYWMPDVFEGFFADFGRRPEEFYRLTRLDPGYEIRLGPDEQIVSAASFGRLAEQFEAREAGSSAFLKRYLRSAGYNYWVAMERVVHKPGRSFWELVMPQTAVRLPQFCTSLAGTVRRGVKDQGLRQMLEFPVLFLGAKPSRTPSFYRFMNYADLVLGTWHVEGGMLRVAEGMRTLAESLGVKIRTGERVTAIRVEGREARGVETEGGFFPADTVIASADYHHSEQLLPEACRNYSESYWQRKTFAPSALLYYIGFGRKVENVSHHTLFFDSDFTRHAADIYDSPRWPDEPLFYASFPSLTDASLAPAGGETAIVLIPVAAGLQDTPELRERYFDQVIGRMERLTGQQLGRHVVVWESYAVSDFMRDYHAYKGNAYGLANTLLQTAFLKPKIFNRRVRNLFYAGQLTVPGPGVPPALISGKIAAGQALKYLDRRDR